MLRSFIVFLMLIVVFLGGMLVGIDRGQIAVNHDDKQEVEISAEQNENMQKKDSERIVEVEKNDEYLTDSDEPMHLTQKTASLLEAGVKGFYEVVVQMLYQISQLFY
ncbi:MAG TPA: hypothetical protein VK091_05080 [Virgibacillus sp.]|nr:hypothetical protein [Virgibacillus sp.]